MSTSKQVTWKKQSGFVWAVLGSVVGFANVLSFSSQCYHNGGGAFLIPYFFAYFLLGIPLLLLEGIIGQKNALPLVSSYGKAIGSKGRFLGWIAVLSCLTIGSFYIVLTSYSVLYTFFSGTHSIPHDTSLFFKESFLHTTQNIGDFGEFAWNIFLVVLLISAFVFWTMIRDISKGVEQVCSMIMPLLTFLVVLFALVASFLPGAWEGILVFLRPDFAKLNDIALWRDVFGQLFFSLSLGLGIITGYSQYNGKDFDLKKAMMWVAIGDFVISFIAGWVVFACVGYMGHLSGIPFNQMIQTDSAFEIGFIIFPKILQTFSPLLQPFLGGIFFFCIFIAGITGVFSIIESITGNLEKEFQISRKKAVSYAIGCTSLIAMFYCFGNGQILIGALAPMVLGINMIFNALMEVIVFLFMSRLLQEDAIWYMASGKRQPYYYLLKYVVPWILFGILCGALWNEFQTFDVSFILRWSWLLLACILSFYLMKRQEQKNLSLQNLVT